MPLRTFHLVVRLGSFTGAAQRLGISQPAVTQQIRGLERIVGMALFDRAGRRIAATDAGLTLDTYAQRIFHLLDAAREAMETLAGVHTGRLDVGASRTAGEYYDSDLLDRFKRRYPGVRVTLSIGNSETITARILDFSLHVGVVAGPSDNPLIVSLPLVRDPLLVVLPPGHRLGRGKAVSIDQLRGAPIILREAGSTTRRLVEAAFLARGEPVAPSMELESNEAIKSAVADGIGIAFMARAAIVKDLGSGRLIGRRLREPLALTFSLVYHRDRTIAPAVAAFLSLLRPRLGTAGPRHGKGSPGRPGKATALTRHAEGGIDG
jgi:LysR family transcriptional regulator, low CO2-responsive transcriptional regulator